MKRQKTNAPVERKLAGASRYPRPTGEGDDEVPLAPSRADVDIIGTLPLTGQLLRAWRDRVGLSQRALAELLDIPQQTISLWERGGINIMHPRILAHALRSIEFDLVLDEMIAAAMRNAKDLEEVAR